MSKTMRTREDLHKLTNEGSTVAVPKAYLELTKGNGRASIFLQQCIWYSDKGQRGNGWFYKSFSEWHDELFFPRQGVETAVRELKKLGVLETEISMAGGHPTTYYRVDIDHLYEMVEALGYVIGQKASNGYVRPPAGIRQDHLPENGKSSIALEDTRERTKSPETDSRLTGSSNPPQQKPRESKEEGKRGPGHLPESDKCLVARALAVVTEMDYEVNKSRIMRTVNILCKAAVPPTPALVQKHFSSPDGFWKAKDWRGKKGDTPKLSEVELVWGKWKPQTSVGDDFSNRVAKERVRWETMRHDDYDQFIRSYGEHALDYFLRLSQTDALVFEKVSGKTTAWMTELAAQPRYKHVNPNDPADIREAYELARTNPESFRDQYGRSGREYFESFIQQTPDRPDAAKLFRNATGCEPNLAIAELA